MDKKELTKRYNEFLKKEKLTNKQAWVGAGGTLLLLDLRSSTQDIDLGVPKDIFDKIRSRGLPEHIFNGDTIVIEYDEVIDLHIDHGYEEHTIIEGVGSWSPEEVLRLKERLNRPKDQLDIKNIKNYLKNNTATESLHNLIFRW